MNFLNTSETLARIGGALPPGHRLLSLAFELAAMAGANGVAGMAGQLFPLKETASGWPGEVGALGDPGEPPGRQVATFLLWLGSVVEVKGLRQLVLYPPPGRYRTEYWNTSDCRLAGVEIGTSTPLVLGPPGEGPFIVLIQRLD